MILLLALCLPYAMYHLVENPGIMVGKLLAESTIPGSTLKLE
jgi:hypothetical protein